MSYKTTDALMRHLRNNGIAISGGIQKRQLINIGYYHGYKGYRFFNIAANRLPFQSFKEIYATVQYDSALKALFYEKIMFIETAVKNIALEGILVNTKSESIQAMFDTVISSYHNSPANLTNDQKQKLQQNKLNLQNSIQSNLARAYRNGNPKITHFYNSIGRSDVPLWALFEILTMGDFGYLLSCLTFDVRDDISKRIGINLRSDTNRELLYKYIYTLKDLRNAVAHNAVIFDTRFRKIDVTPAMRQCLMLEISLPYINFKTLGDYVILVCYYLKLLKISKRDIKSFIHAFETITSDYKKEVNPSVASKVIHADWPYRMEKLKKYI